MARWLLVSLVALSCTSSADQRSSSSLVAAIGDDPRHLNPAITTNGGVHSAAGLLFDGLLILDAQLRPQPSLAQAWQVLDEGRRYRFHLRRDVRWHDGQPFTAADVKFTFDELLIPFHARTRSSLRPALLRVDAPDDSTVEFLFRRPYAPLLQQLDVVEAPILPRHIYGSGEPLRHPANTAPIGTGPFRFVSYLASAEIRYAANTEYFGGAPALTSVVIRVIPDEGTQVIALEAGEVDWLFAVPHAAREQLRRNPHIRLVETTVNPGGSNCVVTLGFNLDRAPFQDVRLRRAIAHAIDREQFLERVLFGNGTVATAPISSRLPGAHARGLTMPAYDTARASALLDTAGWRRSRDGIRRAQGVARVPDGTPLLIRFKALPSQAAYGDLLRAQLRPLGIELQVELLEQAVFVQAVFTARDFDMAIASYCNGMDPEIGVRRQYVSTSVAPIPFSNMAGYRNPVMDDLFDRAAAALDSTERHRLYRRIQELAIADQPYVWLVETVSTRAYHRRCRGFTTASHFAATARCGA
jgi:peptide/nickel transport system substrate-binding protein